MKSLRRLIPPATLWLAATATGALAQSDSPAGGFILDYDIPESPGFVALGVTPNDVLTASAAKPVAAHILNQLLSGGDVDPGVAVDFAPYFLFSGRLRSVAEYREDAWKRRLANLSLSAATIDASDVEGDLLFGLGARVTLFDSHDLLADVTLAQGLDDALAGLAQARSVDTTEGNVIEVVDLGDRGGDLAALYAAARERVRSQPGGALAVGWGFSGRLRGRVLASDSAVDGRHRVWGAYRYSIGNSNDILAMLQWVEGLGSADALTLAGVAVRANGSDVRFTGEVAYSSENGKLEPGVSAEVRVLPGIHLIAALQSEGDPSGAQRLRLHTQIVWAMSEMH